MSIVRRTTTMIVAGVLASGALVASGGAGASAVPGADRAQAVTHAAASTATTASLPRTARAEGTIDDWSFAARGVIAEVGPEVGKVKSGSVALGVDAPVVTKTRSAAATRVKLVPGQTYTFEAYARLLSKKLTSVGAHFALGSTAIRLPKLNADWRKVSGTFTAGANETSAKLVLRVSRAVRGLSIDAVKLTATSGETAGKNVVPNPSFENVTVKRGIVSSSLVVTTPTAAIAVSLPAGRSAWAIYRDGKRIKRTSVTVKRQLSSFPLAGVKQGLYTLKVLASDKKVYKTTVAVVDSPTPWITKDVRFGVGLHVEEASLYRDAARHSRALGLSNVRNDIRWALNETRKGSYDFGVYETAFSDLRANGLKILGIVNSGNPVYGATNARAPITSAGIAAYGRYAAAIAKKFNLLGLEVFNEFNWPDHNKSSCRTATCYMKLVKAVDNAVAKVKPSLPIVVGATAKYQPAWFDSLWKKGALSRTDFMSFHPYEITGHPDDIGGLIKQARSSMKKHGKTTRPIWISELGTSAAKGNRTATEQASVLVRASITAFANGARKFFWYDLINAGSNAKEHYHNFGMYLHPKSGVAAVAPKRAAFAQALTITQLGGRTYRASEKLGTGVTSHAFGSTSDSVRVVWSPKGTKTAKLKTSSSVVLVKFDGTKKTLKPKNGYVTFSVTKNPSFLRTGKATAGVTK